MFIISVHRASPSKVKKGITLQSDVFSCWEKWRATLNLATLRPHAKNKKTNMEKANEKSRYKQRCLYARDTEVLIVDVGFWSKPKIFFLLLTAIYNV